jgi:DNA polymerase-3 subunit gamma/tau
MSTQAFYLKYRPLTFEEVVGQEPITRTLRNALRQGTIRHAYLFTGPRGTGKTTTARLLAKAVNCLAPAEERPCNACAICTAINEGRLLDLIEVDAASNRGIDEIRDIREKARFRPNQAARKVYVLDEAHMLTQEAFNALLKTLEEPPPHVLFVLVTTEPHKIPATIASRCQRFDFKRIPLSAIVQRLAAMCMQEGLRVEPAGLELIARQSTGAMRDAISLLDQMTSYGDEIGLEQVQMVLGTVASEVATRVVACLAAGDVAAGLEQINVAIGDGADPRQLGREIVEILRGILLVQERAGIRLLSASAEQAAEIESLAARVPVRRVVRAIQLFNDATTGLKRAGMDSLPQLPLEMALVQSVIEEESILAAPPSPRQEGTGYAALPRLREGAGESTHSAPPQPAREGKERAQPQPQGGAGLTQAAPTAGASAALALEDVRLAWKKILQAMRQRNRTTGAVLASDCWPVEVHGDQVTVTVPSRILAEKLRDAERMAEIEEVASEVLRTPCRVKLILASEYVAPADSPPVPPGEEGEEPRAEGNVPDQVTRWAQQRGGKARLVEP